jgi:hypothetical protein
LTGEVNSDKISTIMVGLWTDLWFYVSAGGFLVSLALFGIFLRQYRAAVEAQDAASDQDGVGLSAEIEVSPLGFLAGSSRPAQSPLLDASQADKTLLLPPRGQEAAVPVVQALKSEKTVSSLIPQELSQEISHAPSPAAFQEAAGEPAIVSDLQTVKARFDSIEKELEELKTIARSQSEQGEKILKSLAEVSECISRSLPVASPQAASQPEPEALVPPWTLSQVETKFRDPEETIRLGQGLLMGSAPCQETNSPPVLEFLPKTETATGSATVSPPAPIAEVPAGELDLKLSRKGPVWPV